MPMRAHDAVPGIKLARAFVLSASDLGRDYAGCDGAGDALGYLVLDGKHVGHFAIVPIGPEMTPSFGIDQLRGDPHAIAGAPDAAFEHVTHTELARHLPDFH